MEIHIISQMISESDYLNANNAIVAIVAGPNEGQNEIEIFSISNFIHCCLIEIIYYFKIIIRRIRIDIMIYLQ